MYGRIQEATLRLFAGRNATLPENAFDALIALAVTYQLGIWQYIGRRLPLASDAFAAEMIDLTRAGTITQIMPWPFTSDQMIARFDAEAARGGAVLRAAVQEAEVRVMSQLLN